MKPDYVHAKGALCIMAGPDGKPKRVGPMSDVTCPVCRMAKEIIARKALSEEGVRCGIVGCDAADLSECLIHEQEWPGNYRCNNYYCGEHVKVHFHAARACEHGKSSHKLGCACQNTNLVDCCCNCAKDCS